MKKGTFRLHYDDLKDNRDGSKSCLKIVDKKTLPNFVQNEFEKRTMIDLDAN